MKKHPGTEPVQNSSADYYEQVGKDMVAFADTILDAYTPEPELLPNGETLRQVSFVPEEDPERALGSIGGPRLSELTRPDGSRYFYFRAKDLHYWSGRYTPDHVVALTETWEADGSKPSTSKYKRVFSPEAYPVKQMDDGNTSPDGKEAMSFTNLYAEELSQNAIFDPGGQHARTYLRRKAQEITAAEAKPAGRRLTKAARSILHTLGVSSKS